MLAGMKAKAPRHSSTVQPLRAGETKILARTVPLIEARAQPQPFLVHTLPLRVRKPSR